MPATLIHPGMYNEEIPDAPAIIGVSTSVTAFAGWTARGPVSQPGRITSFAAFEQAYGGLDSRSAVGYSVAHFFDNGGEAAYIVRLVDPDAGTGVVTLDGGVTIEARSPGAWSSGYAVVIRHDGADAGRFRLDVVDVRSDPAGQAVETFDDLSLVPGDTGFVVTVLDASSRLVRAIVADATAAPAATVLGESGVVPATSMLTGGSDGVVMAPNDPAFERALLPPGGTGGLYQLDAVELFNLLCVPGETDLGVITRLEQFARDRGAFFIADGDPDAGVASLPVRMATLADTGMTHAAMYFPWVLAADPLQPEQGRAFPPCGFIAGIYARNDAQRGVWKAPAGTTARLVGALGTQIVVSDGFNEVLEQLTINSLRDFTGRGTLVWGARVLHGGDPGFVYVGVRRTAIFIEASVRRGMRGALSGLGDEARRARVTRDVSRFMQGLFRQGAFAGTDEKGAWFVECLRDPSSAGALMVMVGFAPLRAAEFVTLRIRLPAGEATPTLAEDSR